MRKQRASTTRRRHPRRRQRRSGRVSSFRSAVLNPTLRSLRKTGNGANPSVALNIAKRFVKRAGGKDHVRVPRIIPIPKTGGFLIPLFAGLSALGALIGGASSIAKTVNEAKQARKQLDEMMLHNRRIEALAIGRGLYLKKRKHGGLSLYLPKNVK